MNISSYLIDHHEFEWPELLSDWAWLLPDTFSVWLMTKFGDLVLQTEDGRIHFFDVANGSLECIAEGKDDFCDRIGNEQDAGYWFLTSLIDQLVQNREELPSGRCYSFTILPVLGGKYEVGNVATLSVREHYSVLASIHKQIRDLPDGAKIRLVIK